MTTLPRVDWALRLLFLIGATVYVVADRPVLFYDEFNYATGARAVHAAYEDVAGSFGDMGRLGASLANAARVSTQRDRPCFYAPAVFVAVLLRLPFSPDTVILGCLWIYGLLLFGSIGRILRILVPERPEAGVAATAALVLSSALWEMSVVLMGDLAIAAVATFLVAMCVSWAARRRYCDAAGIGLALAWGLSTKPIFLFFALPLVAWVAWRIVVDVARDGGRRRRTTLAFFLIAAPPLPIAFLEHASLLRLVNDLYFVNEIAVYYQKRGTILENTAWPLTLVSQAWPLGVALALMALVLVGLRLRGGRVFFLVTALLLAYVAFFVNQRHIRVFSAFIPAVASLAGFGVAALPRSLARSSAILLAGAAVFMAVAVVRDDTRILDTVFRRSQLIAASDGGSGLRWRLDVSPSPLLRRGDEARHFRIPDVMLATGAWNDPSVHVFVAFATPRFNDTTYQGWLLSNDLPEPTTRRFHSNHFRFGGFGEEGGMNPAFFDAAFVVAKGGGTVVSNADSELYNLIAAEELSRPGSPLGAGLVTSLRLDIRSGESIFLMRRERRPNASEWIEIMKIFRARDPENPWNVRYVVPLLSAPEGDESATELAALANWVLGMAAPNGLPELSDRFPYRNRFAELRDLYSRAWKAAKHYLETK